MNARMRSLRSMAASRFLSRVRLPDFRCVGVEAPTALSSQQPRVDHLHEQRTRAVLAVAEALVQDHLVSEALLEEPIDVLGRRDPVLNEHCSLVYHGH